MEEITIGQLVSWGQVIVTIAGLIVFAYKPIKKYSERLEKAESTLKDHDEEIKGLKQDTRLILKATRVLVAHGATNNEKGELNKVQAEIDEYLINK